MSYFGKKALRWWNYYDHSKEQFIRFNNSTKEIQLGILKKWYPIGTPFKLTSLGIYYKSIFYIKDYKLNQNGVYNIEYIDNFSKSKEKNPILINVDDEFIKSIKREYKIEKLLKNR